MAPRHPGPRAAGRDPVAAVLWLACCELENSTVLFGPRPMAGHCCLLSYSSEVPQIPLSNGSESQAFGSAVSLDCGAPSLLSWPGGSPLSNHVHTLGPPTSRPQPACQGGGAEAGVSALCLPSSASHKTMLLPCPRVGRKSGTSSLTLSRLNNYCAVDLGLKTQPATPHIKPPCHAEPANSVSPKCLKEQ